jgi:hypothetical protein
MYRLLLDLPNRLETERLTLCPAKPVTAVVLPDEPGQPPASGAVRSQQSRPESPERRRRGDPGAGVRGGLGGAEGTNSYKRKLVEEDRAHAALVFDGDTCVAWCQFGPPQELPNIYHRKEVESKMTMPDWRITCIFVDNEYRKKDLSFFALSGALELIKNSGGGVVESYPQDTQGKKYQTRSYIMEQGKPLKKPALVLRAKKG